MKLIKTTQTGIYYSENKSGITYYFNYKDPLTKKSKRVKLFSKEKHLAKYMKECILKSEDLIEDDKDLYAVLKAKLTKKELKLFAMDTADIKTQEIKSELSLDDESLQKAKFKLYKKLKQDKTRLSFRTSNFE